MVSGEGRERLKKAQKKLARELGDVPSNGYLLDEVLLKCLGAWRLKSFETQKISGLKIVFDRWSKFEQKKIGLKKIKPLKTNVFSRFFLKEEGRGL